LDLINILYLQHLAVVKPLLLPAAIMEELELQVPTVSTASGTCQTVTATCCSR